MSEWSWDNGLWFEVDTFACQA